MYQQVEPIEIYVYMKQNIKQQTNKQTNKQQQQQQQKPLFYINKQTNKKETTTYLQCLQVATPEIVQRFGIQPIRN